MAFKVGDQIIKKSNQHSYEIIKFHKEKDKDEQVYIETRGLPLSSGKWIFVKKLNKKYILENKASEEEASDEKASGEEK